WRGERTGPRCWARAPSATAAANGTTQEYAWSKTWPLRKLTTIFLSNVASCLGEGGLLEAGPTMTASNPCGHERISRHWVCGLMVILAAGLGVEGWINRHALNPDGVAYLRLASYYSAGNWHLAVSGYWAPLLSWLMAPLLKLGIAPLVTARILMALSAVVF